jgi:hypothetical protein
MANFDKTIEAKWPDADHEGWNVIRLECGHLTHEPASNTNKVCHCGVCMLNHAAHLRELAEFEKKNPNPPQEPHHG